MKTQATSSGGSATPLFDPDCTCEGWGIRCLHTAGVGFLLGKTLRRCPLLPSSENENEKTTRQKVKGFPSLLSNNNSQRLFLTLTGSCYCVTRRRHTACYTALTLVHSASERGHPLPPSTHMKVVVLVTGRRVQGSPSSVPAYCYHLSFQILSHTSLVLPLLIPTKGRTS